MKAPKGAPPNCASCMYSEHEKPAQQPPSAKPQVPKLRCRRHPPQLWVFAMPSQIQGGKPMLMDLSLFPEVEPSWICGEYERTE